MDFENLPHIITNYKTIQCGSDTKLDQYNRIICIWEFKNEVKVTLEINVERINYSINNDVIISWSLEKLIKLDFCNIGKYILG